MGSGLEMPMARDAVALAVLAVTGTAAAQAPEAELAGAATFPVVDDAPAGAAPPSPFDAPTGKGTGAFLTPAAPAPGAATTTAEEYSYDGSAAEFIPYHPNRPEPDGYHLESRYRNALVVPGSIIFGISYGGCLTVALAEPEVWTLAIPIAGPFITLGHIDPTPAVDEYGYSNQADAELADARFIIAFAGVSQSVAATLLAVGLTHKQQWYVRNDSVAVRVDPLMVPRRGERAGTYGLNVSGRF